MEVEAYHNPVMAKEAIEFLNIKKNSIILDATCGEGGMQLRLQKVILPELSSALIEIKKSLKEPL